MTINTHLKINQALCGKPLMAENGESCAELVTTPDMAADDTGLVHGGFVFGLADYAAMIAVNDPNVVLGASSVKFLKPVRVGETVVAKAKTVSVEGKKHLVSVTVKRGDESVLDGEFICFVLGKHVLG